MNEPKEKIRFAVFLPPWILLVSMIGLSLADYDRFYGSLSAVAGWIASDLAWMLAMCGIICVVLLVIVYCSDFSKVKLAGRTRCRL